MRAVRFHQFGGPEVLRLEEVATPRPEPDHALVKVASCGINRIDLWGRRGALPVKLPHIPGSEIAGTVVEVNGQTAVKPGDAVVVAPWLFCGQCRFCREGAETLCERGGIVGRSTDGGYAEYVVVPTVNLLPLPTGLTPRDGAALALAALTAYHMLTARARLQQGETLLVVGASSGVGCYAVQLGKYLGAQVLATTTKPDKAEWIRAQGADEVIVVPSGTFTEMVKAKCPGGVDVVFEHVGESTLPQSLASLAPNGRVVICGVSGGPRADFDLRPFYSQQQSLLGSRGGSRAELAIVLTLAAAGKIRPVVDQLYPLERAQEAQERMEHGEQLGKMLLTPSGG